MITDNVWSNVAVCGRAGNGCIDAIVDSWVDSTVPSGCGPGGVTNVSGCVCIDGIGSCSLV